MIVVKSDGKRSRDVTVIRNVAATLFLKGGALFVGLLAVPAYMRFFDDQRILGVWFALAATLSWLLNFDVGFGNGARNRLAEALSRGDIETARSVVASTYAATFVLVLLLCPVSAGLVLFVDWNAILGVSAVALEPGTLRSVVAVVFGGVLLQLFLRTISSVLFALQASAAVSLLSLASSACLVAYASLASGDRGAGGLHAFSIVYALAVNIPLFIATMVVFFGPGKAYRPHLRFASWSTARNVMGLGIRFFVLQLLYMLLANVNPVLISMLADPVYVVQFEVYSRPFTALSSLFILAIIPVWSAVTEAIAVGDFEWVRRTYRRLKVAAVIALVGLLCVVPLLQVFVDLWLGVRSIKVSMFIALMFALSASAFMWSGVLSNIANGAGILRSQAVGFAIGVCVKIIFAVAMVEATGSWVFVIVSDIIGLLPYMLLQPLSLRRFVAFHEESLGSPGAAGAQ